VIQKRRFEIETSKFAFESLIWTCIFENLF